MKWDIFLLVLITLMIAATMATGAVRIWHQL